MLARIQFAANITFHILFPAITISLGWILFYFKIKFTRSTKVDLVKDSRGIVAAPLCGDSQKWIEAYKFWVKIFALCFALGVVSGITMSFQFGTNWPGYMNKVGNVAGPLLAYEVLSAFFLEATFLGVMLFGFNRVSNRMHSLATFLVAFGTSLSAFWILVLNSWMHTPAGFEMIDGVVFVTNWMEVIFNPSMPYRIAHMMLASGLTAAFLVSGISAYRWLRNDRSESVLAAMKTGVYLAAFLIPIQIMVGDSHGINTLKYQPAKIAAIEGIWETEKSVPLLLFAIPDQAQKTNHFEVAIPKLASLILTHDLDGEVKGLNEFEGEHPPVAPVFFAFRIMVGVGFLMLAISWFSAFVLFRKNQPNKFVVKSLLAMTFSGWVALIAGWYVTEIGRQPYLVQGVLKTADAVANPAVVSGGMVAVTLTMYLSLYVLLLISFVSVVFYLARKASREV